MSTIKDCQQVLDLFQKTLKEKYSSSLGGGECSNWTKSTSKKILWLGEKGKIAELRSRLQISTNAISMFTFAAIGYS